MHITPVDCYVHVVHCWQLLVLVHLILLTYQREKLGCDREQCDEVGHFFLLQRSDGQIHANSPSISKCFDGRCVMYILLTDGDGQESVMPTATRRRRMLVVS